MRKYYEWHWQSSCFHTASPGSFLPATHTHGEGGGGGRHFHFTFTAFEPPVNNNLLIKTSASVQRAEFKMTQKVDVWILTLI